MKFDKAQLTDLATKLKRYRVALFALLLIIVYGILLYKINSLNNAQPNPLLTLDAPSTVSTSPHIDPATVNKLEQLKDNSVNVQALFNQQRNNPFSQ